VADGTTRGRDGDRHVLMIAYHFPPIRGSSGLQRTLSFCRYLPAYGWRPIVLTVHPRAYPAVGDDQLADIPPDTRVIRCFALDSARHLAIRGAYPRLFALPDRWIGWWFGGVPAGLRLIRRYAPEIIWSTHPVATAHLIGGTLHRLTNVPWVADIRDPMVELDPTIGHVHPEDRPQRAAALAIERLCARRAARAVFCTGNALAAMRRRHAEAAAGRWAVIENGYDEAPFADASRRAGARAAPGGPRRLLHSGLLYASDNRDPTAFFDALRGLAAEGRIGPANLNVVLRATGHDDIYRAKIAERGLAEIVRLEPAIPYRDALAEMLAADGLLVFQGYTSNQAIPAKLYEYLRAGRPIFAMAHPDGATAGLLREAGVGTVVPLDDVARIAVGLTDFLDQMAAGRAKVAAPELIRRYSREARTAELARLLDDAAGVSASRFERDRLLS
jgi:glycosyltransferase involved in cell wall biosynthesis